MISPARYQKTQVAVETRPRLDHAASFRPTTHARLEDGQSRGAGDANCRGASFPDFLSSQFPICRCDLEVAGLVASRVSRRQPAMDQAVSLGWWKTVPDDG